MSTRAPGPRLTKVSLIDDDDIVRLAYDVLAEYNRGLGHQMLEWDAKPENPRGAALAYIRAEVIEMIRMCLHPQLGGRPGATIEDIRKDIRDLTLTRMQQRGLEIALVAALGVRRWGWRAEQEQPDV